VSGELHVVAPSIGHPSRSIVRRAGSAVERIVPKKKIGPNEPTINAIM
jgi:hypothetical protein